MPDFASHLSLILDEHEIAQKTILIYADYCSRNSPKTALVKAITRYVFLPQLKYGDWVEQQRAKNPDWAEWQVKR